MFSRIILFTLSTFFACALMGQDIHRVPIDVNKLRTVSSSRVPCGANSVGGPISFQANTGFSSNATLNVGETIFLCANDSFDIMDIGRNANFGGDPVPFEPVTGVGTQPGVGFAIYDCEPTVDGPDLPAFLGDACLLGDPMNERDVSIVLDFQDPFGGTTTFANDTSSNNLQNTFNNGAPFQWWFAPITFDALNNEKPDWENDPITGEEGPCISLDLDQSFSVVYLNPIKIAVNNFPFGGNPCETRLTIVGGLPEFDETQEYTVEAVNVANSTIRATVTRAGNQNQPYLVNVVASVPGVYEIVISDGKSCAYREQIDMSACVNREVTLESESGTTSIGQEICVPILVEDFNDIVSLGMHVRWDSSILAYSRFEEGFIRRGDVNLITNSAGDTTGYLGVSYLDFGLVPQTLNDGDTLFTLCFIGKAEGSTPIEFTNSPDFPSNGPPIEVLTADSDGNTLEIGLNPKEGTITVIDPNQLTAVIEDRKDACPGDSNGSFDISAFGGAAPYEISISRDGGAFADGPALANEGEVVTFTGLAPGKYEYFIRESTTTIPRFTRDSIEILDANLGVNIAESAPPTCFGFSDGALIANVLGPNATALTELDDFTFIWIDSNGDTLQGQNDQIADNLAAGPYQVAVITNNGCIARDPGGFLSQPTALSVVPDDVAASCSGVADGSIRLTGATGGNAPYGYEWSNGIMGQNNVNIASGAYGYTVTDAGGCELRDTFILAASTELIIRVQDKLDVSCFGFDDGTIDISGTQQGAPVNGTYDFAWSPNATDIDNSVVQSSLVNNLSADTYSVTLTNTGLPAGCMATQDFVIAEPDSLMVETVNITNVSSCSLTNPDGAIDVTFTGGTIATDYQYEFMDTAGMVLGNTAQLTGQPSGVLTIMVTDDNGCQTTIDTAIGTPPPPVIQFFDDMDLACASDVTDLSVIAVPGRAGVTIDEYMWSHDASITGPNANNVGPDTFFVTVIDSDRCASTDMAIVTAPPPIRTAEVAFKPACFATEDGSVAVNIVGGNSGAGLDYDFAWSLSNDNDVLSTTSQLVDVAPEMYDLKVTDATGCEFDTTITLSSLPRIVVDFPATDISGVACFDTPASDCNGSAVANAAYEDGTSGEFTFTWGATGESIGATNTFTSNSLCAGFQNLSVIDTNNCEIIDSVLIPSPDEISLVINNLEDVTCFGADDGLAEIDAAGGNGGFTFAWSDGSTDINRTNLMAGLYDIAIFDQDGCTGQGVLEIEEPAELVASIDLAETNNVICEGDANGRVTVLVTGGNDGLTFNWTNNVSAISSAAGLAPGTYLIDVTDENGCTDQASYEVLEPTPITAQIEWDPIQCNGFQTGIRVMNVSGGNPGAYTFSVDDSPARPVDETIVEFGGDRKISLFDAEGCRVDSIYNIEQPRPLEVTFTESLVEVDLGSSTTLDLEINGDLPIADIFWAQDGEQVDSSFMCALLPCDNPTVNPLNNTVYTAFVTDANDCMAEASITVNVDKNRNVFIPNVFAPNNAGFDTNDRFAVFTGSGVSKINYAKVFNRWGTMVADLTEKRINSASETTEIWDGFIKGEKANQGVYIYIVEVEFIDNTVLLYRGDVALLR